MMSFLKRIL